MTATEGVEIVFDTHAWVEELTGGRHARHVNALHVSRNVGTPIVVLAELAHLIAMRAPSRSRELLDIVRSTSTLLPLDPRVAIAAGRTRAELGSTRRGIGVVDCIILETARAEAAPLLTGDPHLRGLDGVEFLG